MRPKRSPECLLRACLLDIPLWRPRRHDHRNRSSAETTRTRQVLCIDPMTSFGYIIHNPWSSSYRNWMNIWMLMILIWILTDAAWIIMTPCSFVGQKRTGPPTQPGFSQSFFSILLPDGVWVPCHCRLFPLCCHWLLACLVGDIKFNI